MEQQRPTKKQRELLTYISTFIKSNGYGPSYREVMQALGYKSVSTVATHIDGLITRGFLRKRDNSARSLEVVNSHDLGVSVKLTPVKPADTRWLLDRIELLFKKAETEPSAKIIDDLFVLVGALHVLELDEAHRACKARLLTLVRTPTHNM